VKIVGMRTVRESMFKSVTLYQLETASTLIGFYDSGKVYKVERRFNDFKQLHEQLTLEQDYKGFAIPPLPLEDSYS